MHRAINFKINIMAETDNGNSINYSGGQNVKWFVIR